jgi:hypothetical protein
MTPNDPKLSDRRSWRGLCAAGVALLVGMEAQAVTAEPVRCSAWFGIAGSLEKTSLNEIAPALLAKLPLGFLSGVVMVPENQIGVVQLLEVEPRGFDAAPKMLGSMADVGAGMLRKKYEKLLLWFLAVVGAALLCRNLECVYLCCALLKLRVKFAVLRLKMLLFKFQLRKLAVEHGELLLGKTEPLAENLGKRNTLNCVGKNVGETHS